MQTAPTRTGQNELRGQLGQILLATLASTIGFWAWMVIAPLQKTYATELGLDEGQISIMLATPVLVGALGRVLRGQLHRVAGVSEVGEVDPLDHAPVVDVEAGDHAESYGHGFTV